MIGVSEVFIVLIALTSALVGIAIVVYVILLFRRMVIAMEKLADKK
jgi:hypothetical protein